MLKGSVLLAGVLILGPKPAWAADALASDIQPSSPWLFSPTNPEGVASAFPRSPLADVVVNGHVRFATLAQARMRCPTDDVVWVEFGSNHYSIAGRQTLQGRQGAFMCQADASIEGDRP